MDNGLLHARERRRFLVSDAITEESMFLILAFIMGVLVITIVVNWSSIYGFLTDFLFSKPPTSEQMQYSKESVKALVCTVNSVASGSVWNPEGCPYAGDDESSMETGKITGMQTADGDVEINPFETEEEKDAREFWDEDESEPIPGLEIDCKKRTGVKCECNFTNTTGEAITKTISATSERAARGLCSQKAYSVTNSKTSTNLICQQAEYVSECVLKNFELPQDVASAEEWIFTWGDPKFIVYFERFPEGSDDSWNNMFTPRDLIFLFGLEYGIEGATFGLGKYFKGALKPITTKISEVASKSEAIQFLKEGAEKIFKSNGIKKGTTILFYIPKKILQVTKLGGEFIGMKSSEMFAKAATKFHLWFREEAEAYVKVAVAESTQKSVTAAIGSTAEGLRLTPFLDDFFENAITSDPVVANRFFLDVSEELLKEKPSKEVIQEAYTKALSSLPGETFDAFTDKYADDLGKTIVDKYFAEASEITANKMASQAGDQIRQDSLLKVARAIAGSPTGREITYKELEDAAKKTGKIAGGRTGQAAVILWLSHLYDSKNEKFFPWGGTIVLSRPMEAVAPVPLVEEEFYKDTTIVVYKRGTEINKFFMASPCKADLYIKKDMCLVKDWSYDSENSVRDYKTFGSLGIVWEHFDFWDKENACPMNSEYKSDCKVPCVVVYSIKRSSDTNPNFCVPTTPPATAALYAVSWPLQLLGVLFPGVGNVVAATVSATANAAMLYAEKWP